MEKVLLKLGFNEAQIKKLTAEDVTEEIIDEFHIVAENIRHDVGGAQSDRITAVEHDVLRLKKHTSLAV